MKNESFVPAREPRPSYVRHRVEQIARFVQDPNAQEVLASGTINPLRAVALRAILATPRLPSFIIDRTISPKYQYKRAGFDVIGTGFTAITVDDGKEMVRKYYPGTAGADEAAQEAAMETWRRKQDYALLHLAEYAIPQYFSIEENPLNPDESIVTATQKRIHSTGGIDIFTKDIPELATPFFNDSVAMSLASEASALPDLVGKNNALIETDSGAIKLVDPVVLTDTDPGDKNSYVKVAAFLKEVLPIE